MSGLQAKLSRALAFSPDTTLPTLWATPGLKRDRFSLLYLHLSFSGHYVLNQGKEAE